MAGKTIYTGDMIAALEGKIDTMVSSLSNMITALGNQLTELQTINGTVGQSVSVGNIIQSDNVRKTSVNSLIDVTNSVYVQAVKFKVFANGKLKLKCRYHTVASSGKLAYSLDGGTTKTDFITDGTGLVKTGAVATAEVTLTVIGLNEVIVYAYCGTTNHMYVEINGCDVCYDLVNLAVDGYVVQS